MKNILLLFLIPIVGFCQSVEVSFKMSENPANDLLSVKKIFTLTQNDNESIYFINNVKDISQLKYASQAQYMIKKDTLCVYMLNDNTATLIFNQKTYKNYSDKKMYFNDVVDLRIKNFDDNLDLQKWNLVEGDSIIGGYHCQKAITNFRGRDYIAYYSSEVANQGGPWKFDGLPGMILFVKSKDNYLIIEPTEIKILPEKKSIQNPFSSKKTFPFSDFPNIVLDIEKKNFLKEKTRNPYYTRAEVKFSGTIEIFPELLKNRVYE